MIDAALAERERLTRAHVQSALACSWTGHIYDYEQVAKQLNLVVDALLAVCANEARKTALWDAAEAARRTPFRCHAANDVDFHSGCVQTRDGIVDAIRALKAEG